MTNITKVSDITVNDIEEYIRLAEPSTEDTSFLTNALSVAKDYIKSYTGLVSLDTHESLIIVVFVLCQDMFDNRTLYVDKTNLNNVVSNILDMYRVNLL